MLLHRRPLALAVLFALLALPASARNTLVDVRTPYTNGVVALAYSDTVSFSAGITLIGVSLCGANCDNEDGVTSAVGYRGVAYGSVGMRWAPGATRPLNCRMPGIANSPDSVWDAIGAAPDSTVTIDTMGGYYFKAQTNDTVYRSSLIVREWICYRYLPPSWVSWWVPDWNIIAYAHCPDSSHMAFQFAYDTVLGGPTGQVVRWAVDSAGNGVFKIDPVAVAPRAVRESTALQRFDRTASSKGTLFDLRGRRTPTMDQASGLAALRSGVYLQATKRGAVRVLR